MPCKSIFTKHTFVGSSLLTSLIRVNLHVVFQNTFLVEGFPTLVTRKLLLPGVDFLMILQEIRLIEGFPTLLANIRFLSGVSLHVILEVNFVGQGFPTLQTLERLLVGVSLHVVSEVDFLGESDLAFPTLERLLPGVGPRVVLEVHFLGEDFPALGTLERPLFGLAFPFLLAVLRRTPLVRILCVVFVRLVELLRLRLDLHERFRGHGAVFGSCATAHHVPVFTFDRGEC